MNKEEETQEIQDLKKTISALNQSIKNIRNQNSNNQLNWIQRRLKDFNFFIRTFGRDKSEIMFQITRLLFFLLILVSLAYAVFKFSAEASGTFNKSTKDYSIDLIQELDKNLAESKKTDSTIVSLTNLQKSNLEKIITKSSEEILKIKSDDKDIKALKLIEHIFIYLLPFLVLIGLYFYFEANFKNKLLGNEPNENEIEISKKTLNATKYLFISSIMSYIIIKIIEKVLLIPKEEDLNITKIIAYGSLLFLLMLFLILSHKGEHSNNSKEH